MFSTTDKLLCSKSPHFIGALRRLFKTPVDRRFWTWFLFSLTLFVKVATPRNPGKDNVLASTVSLLMNSCKIQVVKILLLEKKGHKFETMGDRMIFASPPMTG